MAITKKDIEHIARLARIELAPGDEEKFERELSAILDFVARLNEVDTSGVSALAGGTNLENVMRSDEIRKTRGVQERDGSFVKAAPEVSGEYIAVPAIFERT